MTGSAIEHGASEQISLDRTATRARLRDYYAVRAAVAAAWVLAAFTVGRTSSGAAAALLIAYPLWDSVANVVDATRNGGMRRNVSQTVNAAASGVAAAAVATVVGDMNAVLSVFGAWAIVAGLLQLATGVRRWKADGAQWAMVLSGAQSALAGGLFIKQSLGSAEAGIEVVAPYAAFGAFYFGVSALWLVFRRAG